MKLRETYPPLHDWSAHNERYQLVHDGMAGDARETVVRMRGVHLVVFDQKDIGRIGL